MKKELTGYPHIDKPWMKYYEGTYVPQEEPKTNMVEVLKERNKWRMNKTAYQYYGNSVSYEEMFHNSNIASKVLTQVGVKKGEIILNMVPNIPEEEEIWFGATQIGAICDYIDPRPDSMDIMANAKKVFEIIKYEKPKYIVTIAPCYLAMLKPIENELKEFGINDIILLNPVDSMDEKAQLEYMKDIINYDSLKKGNGIVGFKMDSDYVKQHKTVVNKMIAMQKESEAVEEAIKSSPLNIYKYKDLVSECKNSPFEIVNESELINYIGHTSGTSGARPKPITLSNKNAIASIAQCGIAGVGPKEGESSLHVLPGFAPFGRYNNDIQTYYNKGINIHVPEFVFGEFGYLLKKYKPNVIMTPPSFLTALPDCEYLSDETMTYLNKIVYGGDSMNYQTEQKINEWLKEHGCNAEVEKGHGMSEFCGCGTFARDAYNKPNTIGIPAPKTIYTMVDPTIEDKLVPLKFNEGDEVLRGEIVVSAGHVTNGKLHGEVIVPHYEMDGRSYIRTKDIGYMDRDGCFFIDERKGRSFARVDGYKIKPSEIEKSILENPYVKDAKVVPYYDERMKGTMPICHVVLKEEEYTPDDEIKIIEDIVYNSIIGNPTMSSRQIPAKFKVKAAMPLNKGNKVDIVSLTNEKLTGDEINVDVDETNVIVEGISIYRKPKGKIRVKKD